MTIQNSDPTISRSDYFNSESHYIPGVRIASSNEPTEESIAFADYCRELFEYKEGQLIRKINRGKAKAGDVAGFLSTKGYLSVRIDKVDYKVHRIVFLIHYNYLPETIDHIDRDRVNNRIENLRSVSIRENNLNRNNNSNIYKNGESFQVMFMLEGSSEYFGIYKTLEEAEVIRDKVSNDLDNWKLHLPIKTKDMPNRYISKNGDGYRIQKTINRIKKSFGTYKTLEEAIEVRDKLESSN